jgi:hypothetical protein
MKTKLDYTVRTTRAPGETTDTWTPMIVDRLQPTGLEAVIEKCIDRGLITGIKTTAAKTIADGVAEQLAYEFKQGRGIQFGQYFYGRPYLSGQVDANGRLMSDNSIDVRLYKGAAFKLSRDDFSLSFIEGGNNPTISFVICAVDGKQRGEVVQGSNVKLNGKMLYGAGDTVKVKFAAEDGESAAVEVSNFTAVSTELLAFVCPCALVAGKRYLVSVERTDANGVVRVSATKPVTILASEEPEPIGESTDGTVKVFSIVDADPTAEVPTSGHQWKINGEGLRSESAEGDEWLIDNVDIRGDGFQELFQIDSETPDHTQLTITCPDLEAAAGDYTATITINLSRRGGEDTEAITINKMVRIPQA